MVRSHYNQKARLRQFARPEGKHHKVTMVDLKNHRIGNRNIETAFYEEGLYSDELEKELKVKVEDPGMKIFDKIYKSDRFVVLTRAELEMMKKYLLIQQYRNPSNISHYDPEWEGDIIHYNRQKFADSDETYKEYVYRMMHEVLDHSWGELIESDIMEIRNNAMNINGTRTMFVRSNHEFVINDIGLVTERQPWSKFTGNKEIRRMLETWLESERVNATGEELDRYIASHQYHDNFTFYPISSRFGIVTIDGLWVMMMKFKEAYKLASDREGELYTTVDPEFFRWMRDEMELESGFIQQNFVPCIPNYKSDELKGITSEQEFAEKIGTYKDQDDTYLYPVIDLMLDWSLYLNRLTINEAQNYFAFGSNMDGRISIDNYEMERLIYAKEGDAKNDLSWIQNTNDWTKPLI
ncbi:MAG: DUF4238 domain-containing protein [Candidatus Methanomethylophilaceae archaeon]|nr:DUF4238 domain-containing protein [Candidatus Methanomethylophilaceae archaeon]